MIYWCNLLFLDVEKYVLLENIEVDVNCYQKQLLEGCNRKRNASESRFCAQFHRQFELFTVKLFDSLSK